MLMFIFTEHDNGSMEMQHVHAVQKLQHMYMQHGNMCNSVEMQHEQAQRALISSIEHGHGA
jgi:hypothetical protein